jgi:hypothetical protein
MRSIHSALAIGLAALASAGTATEVAVYGGTPAGIAAAVAAARAGMGVTLVEPHGFVGGMLSNGLSHPDFRTFEGLSGLYLEFTRKVEEHYAKEYGVGSPQVRDSWHGTHGEPKVNRRVLEAMLAAARVEVLTESRLTRLRMVEGRIEELVAASPTGEVRLTARVFIDASYEGDLMAAAGEEFLIGREARSTYGESLAPEVADDAVQGYNFRLTMTSDPALRMAVPAPPGYHREEFLAVLPMLEDGRIGRIFSTEKDGVFKTQTPPLPNEKRDINDISNGLIRLSLPGLNHRWPHGDTAERAAILARHLRHNIGLLHFLQHDAAVPERFRREAIEWGLCRDEFANRGHLPEQLYVREARRMIGKHVFTQADTSRAEGDARARHQPDSIAIGDYGLNCHGATHSGPIIGGRHGGEFYHRTPPYQIPYGVIVPKKTSNLLVPGAMSASHVGFCALRFEPVWMSLGEAAGTAAALAVRDGLSVADVPPQRIRDRLHRAGVVTIYVSDVLPGHPDFAAVQSLGALGGLHGLNPPPAEGPRGAHLRGQYFHAYPAHHAGLDLALDQALFARWRELARKAGLHPPTERPPTRGAFIRQIGHPHPEP